MNIRAFRENLVALQRAYDRHHPVHVQAARTLKQVDRLIDDLIAEDKIQDIMSGRHDQAAR